MTAQETSVVNAVSTTLNATMAAGATSLVVASASGIPAVPFYIVVDPDVPAKREYMLIDSSVVGTTLSMTATSKRNLSGSAGDVEHTSGAVVRVSPPMRQLFDDIHDRIDAVDSDLTTVETTANAALPKAGGTMTGDLTLVDEAYDAAGWNGDLSAPTKNAVRDKIEDILDGVTFTGDVVVPDEAYDATAWNGSLEVPTKNAVRDKIESLAAAGTTETVIVKPSDETVISSTTLQADDHLVVALEANSRYTWSYAIRVNSAATPDFKYQWTVPAAAVFDINIVSGSGGNPLDETSAARVISTGGSDEWAENPGFGSIITGANAGNLTFTWAQNTLTASNTKVLAGSWLKVTKVT